MNIQSISIVVPTKGCVNSCKFCVSCMHSNDYSNDFDEIQIKKRIKFAINNGVNTCILTGTGEALQNIRFLSELSGIFDELDHPFPNVELQTTGVLLNKYSEGNVKPYVGVKFYDNIKLLKKLRVNTISLSVSDIYSSLNNSEIIGVSDTLRFELKELCNFIKDNGFNLRLSLNMTKSFDYRKPVQILQRCKDFGADQITFRKLYHSNDGSPQSEWVKENACEYDTLKDLENYIAGHWVHNQVEEWREGGKGKALYRLPFGAMAYSIMGMSTVVDDNCMSKEENEKLKYVILRENGKLYAQWDDEGSLIF